MSEAAAYKLGPGRMDVAVRLGSGAWMRLANKHTLTKAEAEAWTDLVPDTGMGVAAYSEAFERGREHALAQAAEQVIEQAEKMGFAEGLFAEKPPSPERQRMMLLEKFGQNPDGLTVKEAAEKAGLIGVVTYTSRFATDLISGGCLAVRTTDEGDGITSVVKRGRAKVYMTTTEGYRRLRAGSAG